MFVRLRFWGPRIIALWLILLSVAHAKPTLIPVEIAVVSQKPETLLDNPNYLPELVLASQMAADERKAEFAAKGYLLKLRPTYTDFDSTTESLQVYKDLALSSVVAVIGPQSSDETMMAIPALAQSDLVLIPPTASSTELLNYFPQISMFGPSNLELVKVFERVIGEQYPAKTIVAVVAWDSAYSKNFFMSLSEPFKKKVQLIKTTETLSNVDEIVQQSMALKPDLILLPNFPVVSATYVRAFSQAGFKGIFLGGDSWGEGSDPRFSSIVNGASSQGFTLRPFTSFYETSQRRAKRKLFSEKYSSVFSGNIFGTTSAAYYDATQYLLDTLKKVRGPINRQKLIKEIKAHRAHKGILGKHCISNSKCSTRSFYLIGMKNGKFYFSRKIDQ